MITYHTELTQGTGEWMAQRRGILTASEMHLVVTPTLKSADNDKTRAHLYELLAQRVTGYTEPHYVSDDMLRGTNDELKARALYSRLHAPVTECGFVTREWDWGTIGYSPDGLVGDTGLIECKSRKQKHQVRTFIEWQRNKSTPSEFAIQVQTGLLVTQREWVDLVSYSGGMPMCVMRVFQDHATMSAIERASEEFYARLAEARRDYETATAGLPLTERSLYTTTFTPDDEAEDD